jgi:hypothetical protein
LPQSLRRYAIFTDYRADNCIGRKIIAFVYLLLYCWCYQTVDAQRLFYMPNQPLKTTTYRCREQL